MVDRDSEIRVKFMMLYTEHVIVSHVLGELLGFAMDRNLDIKH